MTKPIDIRRPCGNTHKTQTHEPQQTLNTKVKSESWRCP
ncbi:hypothetical protein SEA_SANDALPHON_90 [Mycobacterium phage Sandalphon]|uniref:Uncharacterized protein n=7 Tax=Cheoctovirus TaxID=1623281 RepID=A0A0K1Y7C8_9CAUD|nr:hypothetical protein M609_gp092 [Mycobacterium phage Job42]YP_009212732.1 hypothetical protein AVV07_gp090 [Mycobacterium phage Dante]YP_009954672.1 GIY-YIG endonuclease [Mycobacterium phage Batiatus]YP_009955493.1 hypothetical protein I5H22_gp085 [Mycobacterium phage Chuckly]YP_009959557.1 hypothetical protein I5H61_gp091 [Mycobacterium phage Mattes]YP_009959652.1 hypothetical protein I5H62_gp81 [Mycobacterium phage Melissauren88]YP_009962130.1 hypothetical protein I5H86_gp090 [Mycobacter